MKHITTFRYRGFTQIELAVLLGITGLFGVQIIPAINDAREAARRNGCKNNLHQIAIAVHNYADTFRGFPNGWVQHTCSVDEGLSYGWETRLLPYIDQARLFNQIDFEGVLTTESVPAGFWEPIDVLRCPSDDTADLNAARDGWATSNYVGNFGSKPPPRWNLSVSEGFWPGEADTPVETDGIFMINKCIYFTDITDGESWTFLAGERCGYGNAAIWMGVRGNRFESDVVAPCSWDSPLNLSTHGFSSRHPDGSHFVMCDGAVRFIANDIDQANYERLASRNDGQRIDAF